MLVFCTDEGLQFAELKPTLQLIFRAQMAILTDKMIRAGVLIGPSVVLCAEFDRPGYMIVNCNTRQVIDTIVESN